MRVVFLFLTMLFFASICRAAPEEALRIIEPWGAVFAGEPAVFNVEITPAAPDVKAVGWSLLVGRRAIARREVPVTDGKARIEVQVPNVRDGLHVRALLRVERLRAQGGKEAEVTRVLHIFGKDVFATRRTWLRELDLRLFDPGKDTAELFDEENIPYRIVRDARRLGEPEGIVLAGEGRQFQKKSSVLAAFADFAARGGRVLVLAPGAGSMHFPGSGAAGGARPAVALRDAGIIHDLDKRLDAGGWPPNGDLAARGFAVESRHPEVVLSVQPPDQGWPWVSLDYPSGGRMILCAFPVVETWAESPNARMLFLAVLAEFAEYEERAGETEK
mgnify:CR=1 FL=1